MSNHLYGPWYDNAGGRIASGVAGMVMLGRLLRRIWREEDAATAIEYALIAVLISVAAIVAMTTIGGSVRDLFTVAADALERAAAGS